MDNKKAHAITGGLLPLETNTMTEKEPIIHSHISDCLDDFGDPRAYTTIMCEAAQCAPHPLHAPNNECMETWVEFAGKNVCGKVFGNYLIWSRGVIEEDRFLHFIRQETLPFYSG